MHFRHFFHWLVVSILNGVVLVHSFANAQTLTIVTDDGPPHMIKATDSGIDIDITRQVLMLADMSTLVSYAPLGRAAMMVRNQHADVVVPTFYEEDSELFVSDPIIQYRPTVFTLADSDIKLQSLSDLSGLRVVTFQGAKGYFGPEFSDSVANADYTEMHDMSKLPSLLLMERTDVVVLDFYIFHYYARQNAVDYAPNQVVANNLIPVVNAYAGFNNEALRDTFNRALANYKAEGKDVLVIEKYLGH